MAYLKSDFLAMLAAAAQTRPAAAEAYRTGDPRMMAMMESVATMLAAISGQIDLAEAEPFLKARDGTVLADASLKGILPLAKPARAQIVVKNNSGSSLTFATGRELVDPKGRVYAVESGATVAAGGTGVLTARQETTRTDARTVASVAPFYAVQIAPSGDGAFISGIGVADGVGPMTYREDFCNIGPGDRVFHVETDEARRLWIRFGDGNGYGHLPANGDVLTITVRETAGLTELAQGAAFTLETVTSSTEAECTFTLDQVLASGANPPSMETLRMLSRYPGLHDGNAVMLADFDWRIRSKVAGIEFLSVWNEQTEEVVRGPSVDHINRLFVSVSSTTETTPNIQAAITAVVAKADDSYRLTYVPVVLKPLHVKVVASVASVHDVGAVQGQIRTALLAKYGRGTPYASRGLRNIRIQDITATIRDAVAALQDPSADFSVTLQDTAGAKPEEFRYMESGTVDVVVSQITDSLGLMAY